MIVDKIYWIKAERTKSRSYRLHLVRKLNFLCLIFMENTAGTPITLAKVELQLDVLYRQYFSLIQPCHVKLCNFVEDGAQKVIADKTITKTHLLLIVNLLFLNVVNVLKPDC